MSFREKYSAEKNSINMRNDDPAVKVVGDDGSKG